MYLRVFCLVKYYLTKPQTVFHFSFGWSVKYFGQADIFTFPVAFFLTISGKNCSTDGIFEFWGIFLKILARLLKGNILGDNHLEKYGWTWLFAHQGAFEGQWKRISMTSVFLASKGKIIVFMNATFSKKHILKFWLSEVWITCNKWI